MTLEQQALPWGKEGVLKRRRRTPPPELEILVDGKWVKKYANIKKHLEVEAWQLAGLAGIKEVRFTDQRTGNLIRIHR